MYVVLNTLSHRNAPFVVPLLLEEPRVQSPGQPAWILLCSLQVLLVSVLAPLAVVVAAVAVVVVQNCLLLLFLILLRLLSQQER